MITEERLLNLERKLGRQKRYNYWLSGVFIIFAGIFTVHLFFQTTNFRAHVQATDITKEIRAKSFVLEDESSNPRASLYMSEAGPSLTLFDKTGEKRVQLSAGEDVSGLYLLGKKIETRASIFISEGGPALVLYGENGKGTVTIGSILKGPFIALADDNGIGRAMLSVPKHGPMFSLFDENNKERLIIGSASTRTPDGKIINYPESSLLLFKPDGNVIWSAIK